MTTVCSSCEREIVWALTARGKRMPLDADPVEEWTDLRGKFVLRDGVALAAVNAPPEAGEQVYVSHFATCPQAAQHRRAS